MELLHLIKRAKEQRLPSEVAKFYPVGGKENSCDSCNSWQVFLASILSARFLPRLRNDALTNDEV